MNLPRIFPESTPRSMRISVLVFFCLFELFGLALSLRALIESASSFWAMFLGFLALGVAGVAVIGFFWQFLTKIARKNSYQKVESFFRERGYCPEMAETIKNIMPAPTKRDNVLRIFVLVMGEDYEAAEVEMAHINEPSLLQREYAMLTAAKLRLL